jgi:hypothetical protein
MHSLNVRGLTRPEKNVKIKEIKASEVSKLAPSENGPQHGEIRQPKRAQYLTHLHLSPYPNFPAELASILLIAFSLFALVAALVHFTADMLVFYKSYS